jgi:hypothetical protein
VEAEKRKQELHLLECGISCDSRDAMTIAIARQKSTALMRHGLWLTDPAETGSLGLEAAGSDIRLNVKPAGQGS